MLSTGKAARLCSVKPDTVLKWIKKGRLPATRTPGGHFRIDEQDLPPLLSHLEDTESHDGAEPPPRPQLRCWEYMSETSLREECKNCVVFRTHAVWCFELVRLVRGSGHTKRFCTGSCQDCPYYRRAHHLPTNVLLVTRDESLIQAIAKRANGCVAFRYARNGYDASAIISVFRPALVVVDKGILEGGEAALIEALAADARAPGVRILLAVRHGGECSIPAGSAIAGTIDVPFCCDDIARWMDRYPVEPLEDREREKLPA